MLLLPWGWILAHSGLGTIWIRSPYCDCLWLHWDGGVGIALLSGTPCPIYSWTTPYKPFSFACCSQGKWVSLKMDNKFTAVIVEMIAPLLLLYVCIYRFITKQRATERMEKPLGGSPQVGISLFLWRVYCLAQVLVVSVPIPMGSDTTTCCNRPCCTWMHKLFTWGILVCN